MGYRILADIVVVIHLLFTGYVVLGGLLALRRIRWLWLHLTAVAWGVALECWGFICPLTPLENWLRAKGGAAGYKTGFVAHYLLPLLYPEGLTRSAQIWLGFGVVAVNAVIYGYVLMRRFSSSTRARHR